MGKNELQQNLHQQQAQNLHGSENSGLFCEGCSMGISKIVKEFNFRCFVVLILSLSVLVSGLFWLLPFHSIKYGFDAKYAIKIKALVQVSFRLQKPVCQLIPHIAKLEYDIYEEISVPDTQVAILSMHRSSASNWTDVVFGVLPDPMNVSINPVSLSVLRSSLVELFLQISNLTLTTSIFGHPSSFEIVKFIGGVTIIPVVSPSIWHIPQILFNFTLNNSISEILENFDDFEEQLKSGLNLMSYENVYVQITNKDGSTIASPVTVQASVISDMGSLVPQRLKQLAQTITGSPADNLGLDNSVFGKVKSINLSSYLKGKLHATPPTPSPAPAPAPLLNDYAEPESPLSYSPAASPFLRDVPPCSNCGSSSPSDSGPFHSPHISNSPAPSIIVAHSPDPCPNHDSSISPTSSPTSHSNPIVPPPQSGITYSPAIAPTPAVSYGSIPGPGKESARDLVSSSHASPPSCKLLLSSFRIFASVFTWHIIIVHVMTLAPMSIIRFSFAVIHGISICLLLNPFVAVKNK